MARNPNGAGCIESVLRLLDRRVILIALNFSFVAIIEILVISFDRPAFAAEENNNSLSVTIQRSASDLEQLQLALQSPDASTRYSAFARAIDSGRPEMREMAISVGFSSADQALQQMAVRAAFIGITYVAPRASSVTGYHPELFRADDISVSVESYDWRVGAINTANARGGYGQVNGSNISYLSKQQCTVNLTRLSQSWEFQGTAECRTRRARISYTLR